MRLNFDSVLSIPCVRRLIAVSHSSSGDKLTTWAGTITLLAIGFGLFATPILAEEAAAKPHKPISFSSDVKPILTEKCQSCHGGDEPKGGLRMNERQAVLSKGDSGRIAVVPNQPHESELVRRILSDSVDERMPPQDSKQLTPDEIQVLKRWVAEGAAWSAHWAFQPIVKSTPPDVVEKNWVRNPIDQFVLQRLEQQAMMHAAEADRFTLIKRLHYDLIGLPPTIEEVDSFVADSSPEAYANLVVRLLKSPHFGERWGRHWLDLAHFADSDGYEKDRARPDAYLYRDWVIDAINRDLPFDQFTVEQIAGDLLPQSTGSQRIATGFLRQTLTNEEGGVDQEEYRIAAVFDRTETVGTVWMGLTVGCVRCHDHKYDPLKHTEYYSLFAFFNNSEEVYSPIPIEADNLAELQHALLPLEEALLKRAAELAVAEREWETVQRERVMSRPEGTVKEQALEVISFEAATTPKSAFRVENGEVLYSPENKVASTEEASGNASMVADKDVYTLTVKMANGNLTGFKLYALPDEKLPGKGSGLSDSGNFVLTHFEALLVDANGQERPIELHRAKADFVQAGFAAERALIPGPDADKSGWAIGGKTGDKHSIQFRTLEPLTLGEGSTLKVVLSQQYGSRHLLGRFRLAALTSGERGLDLPDEKIADALEMYPEKRVANIKQLLFDYYVKEVARDEQSLSLQQQIAELIKAHHAKLMDIRTLGTPRLPRVTKVFHRGDFLTQKETVQPAVPKILSTFQSRGEQADRLDLARWLISPENMLTSRVAVNNVWQHLFGLGLVRTPSDFGTRGEPPTHPELLDWLAANFRDELKWSRKELIRLIVSSATYRQSSNHRPEFEKRDAINASLFRQNRFRVESEVVRDLTLAVAGILSSKVGGPSVFPPMPDDLAKLSYANSFAWKSSEGDARFRRGMYTFFKRTIPHPNLMTFDSPDANVACCARTISDTPLQALTLLNNEVHAEAAQAFCVRLLNEIPSATEDEARLTRAIRLCVGRQPSQSEVYALARVLASARDYYKQHPDDAPQVINKQAPKDIPASEAAAWVATLRVVLNLDEFITRE